MMSDDVRTMSEPAPVTHDASASPKDALKPQPPADDQVSSPPSARVKATPDECHVDEEMQMTNNADENAITMPTATNNADENAIAMPIATYNAKDNVVSMPTATHNTAENVFAMSTATHNAEDNVVATPTVTHNTDENAISMPTVTHNAEENMVAMPTATHNTEENVVAMSTATHNVEDNVVATPTVTPNTDENVIAMPTATHDANENAIAMLTTSHNADENTVDVPTSTEASAAMSPPQQGEPPVLGAEVASELCGEDSSAVVQFPGELGAGELGAGGEEEEEGTTTIYAYIDSEGNLRGRSSTGEDVLLQVEADMPDDDDQDVASHDALLQEPGNVVVIQDGSVIQADGSMIHTDGDVTYIVQQQQPEMEDEEQGLQPPPPEGVPSTQPHQHAQSQHGQAAEQEGAPNAAGLVYFEEEALETAEFQIVGVEVETQGGAGESNAADQPAIIIDGCQVICQEPPTVKKRPNNKTEPATSPSKAKPKKPRKRKSSQKDTSAPDPAAAGDNEPSEKVTVQNLYDKSIEMVITENSSSQKQTAPPTGEDVNSQDPSPKSKRRNKSDTPSKQRRRSKKNSEADGGSPRGNAPQQMLSSDQAQFEESELSKTLDTATSVINQTMSAVGCQDTATSGINQTMSEETATSAPAANAAFNCRLCHKFSSLNEDEVKTHIVKEHARKICFIYRCDLCPAYFVTEPEITDHFREKHPVAHVENISIVTNIEKALATSADNIKIFYEQKKSASSPDVATSGSMTPTTSPRRLSSLQKTRSPKRSLPPIQSDIAALLESQLRTAVTEKQGAAPPSGHQHAGPALGPPPLSAPPLTTPAAPLTTPAGPLSAPPLPAAPLTTYTCRLCPDVRSSVQWQVRNHVLSEHIRSFPSVVHLCYACPHVATSKEAADLHVTSQHPGLPTSKVRVISDLEMLLILYASATDISQKGKIFHWNVKTNHHEEVGAEGTGGGGTGVLTKYVCSVCETFETHFEWQLRQHIAAEHTEGVGYLCDLCCIFGTMEKHKAMLHCRLRHPKEQPNYKVLDWAVICDTVVRVTDSYYSLSSNPNTAANTGNYFFGPGKLPSVSEKSAMDAADQRLAVLEPGQIPPSQTHPRTTLASSSTSTVPAVSRATSLSPAQPVDYSLAVSQPGLLATPAPPASTLSNQQSKAGRDVIMAVPGQSVAARMQADNILTVPTRAPGPPPPPPLVLPPAGPQQKSVASDVHSFRCLVCHYTSLSLPDIVKHITVWHVDATMYPYTCPLCDLPGWEYNIILDHLRQIHKSSSYLPIINPGKVEFLRRYVNRFWIEHRPPATPEAGTPGKKPRPRKRKASNQVAENDKTALALDTMAKPAASTLPEAAMHSNAFPGTSSAAPGLIQVINAPDPGTNATPATTTPKPKRRRRSNQQKAIQDNFQIPVPGVPVVVRPPPGMVPAPGMQALPGARPAPPAGAQQAVDPRFIHSPMNRMPQPTADQPFTPTMMSPQRAPIPDTTPNKQPPASQATPTAPVTPPALQNNKKGRNLDKGIRYYCKLCSYSTPQLVYADSHAKCTHLKIRPFYCPYCTSFAGALEHKAKMHVTFKHKDMPVKVQVNEEAVALLEIEARKLYEARRTDDNTVVDIPQQVSEAPRTPALVEVPSNTKPAPALTPANQAATLTPPGGDLLIPVPVAEEVTSDLAGHMMPPIPSIQITEPPPSMHEPPSSTELPDELQMAVQSLMDGPLPEDDQLPVAMETISLPGVEVTATLTEHTADLALSVPAAVLAAPDLPLDDAASSVLPSQQVALSVSSEPIVQHAVTEIAETMASMCSQVVIHQPRQASATEEDGADTTEQPSATEEDAEMKDETDADQTELQNAAEGDTKSDEQKPQENAAEGDARSDADTTSPNITQATPSHTNAQITAATDAGTEPASDATEAGGRQVIEQKSATSNQVLVNLHVEEQKSQEIPNPTISEQAISVTHVMETTTSLQQNQVISTEETSTSPTQNQVISTEQTGTSTLQNIEVSDAVENATISQIIDLRSLEEISSAANAREVKSELISERESESCPAELTEAVRDRKETSANHDPQSDASLHRQPSRPGAVSQPRTPAAKQPSNQETAGREDDQKSPAPSAASSGKPETGHHDDAGHSPRVVHYTLSEQEGTLIIEANVQPASEGDGESTHAASDHKKAESASPSDEQGKPTAETSAESHTAEVDRQPDGDRQPDADRQSDADTQPDIDKQPDIDRLPDGEVKQLISSQSDGNSDDYAHVTSCRAPPAGQSTQAIARQSVSASASDPNDSQNVSALVNQMLVRSSLASSPDPDTSDVTPATKNSSQLFTEMLEMAAKKTTQTTPDKSHVNSTPDHANADSATKLHSQPADDQSTNQTQKVNSDDKISSATSKCDSSTRSPVSQQTANDAFRASPGGSTSKACARPAISPDMVGDLAMDIVQATVSDMMTAMCTQTLKDANALKVAHPDRGHSLIVGRCIVDDVVPRDVYTKTSPLTAIKRKTQTLLSHSTKCDLIETVISKNGMQLRKHRRSSNPYKPMPLSVKLKKYPGFKQNNRHAPYPTSSEANSVISATYYYCTRCCHMSGQVQDIQGHVTRHHVTRCSSSPQIEGAAVCEGPVAIASVRTALQEQDHTKLLMRTRVSLPNIFQILTESGGV